MLIRKMNYLDVDTIVEIEKELFTSPWSRDDLYYEVERKMLFRSF